MMNAKKTGSTKNMNTFNTTTNSRLGDVNSKKVKPSDLLESELKRKEEELKTLQTLMGKYHEDATKPIKEILNSDKDLIGLNKLNKQKPSLKPVDMSDKIEKLEQQRRKKEEDLKLKELEKLDPKFKRNKSSAKAKKIIDPILEETQKKLMENLTLNSTTSKGSRQTGNKSVSKTNSMTNASINQIANQQQTLKDQGNNTQTSGKWKIDKTNVDESELRRTKKTEKIEIDCDTSRNGGTPSKASRTNANTNINHNYIPEKNIKVTSTKQVSNKGASNIKPLNAMDILKNDLEKNELDSSNILSRSLQGSFKDESFYDEDKYNNIFNKNIIDEYFEVYNFLESLNLHGKYFNTFIQNEYLDMQAIFLIEEKQLDEMKIKGGSKAKILHKIKDMKESSKKFIEEAYGGKSGQTSITNEINGLQSESAVGTENSDFKKLVKGNMSTGSSQSEFYDEELQRRLFQEAVMEFRGTGKKSFSSKMDDFTKQLTEDNNKRVQMEKDFLKKEKEKAIQPNLNIINEVNEVKEEENPLQASTTSLNTQPKKNFLYNIGGDALFNFESTAPFGESGTDPMSIPLGDKISCWNCFKVIMKDNSIEDKVIYGKKFCSVKCLDKYKVRDIYVECSLPSCRKVFDKCSGHIYSTDWYCSIACQEEAASSGPPSNRESTKIKEKVSPLNSDLRQQITKSVNVENRESCNDKDEDDDYDPMLDF